MLKLELRRTPIGATLIFLAGVAVPAQAVVPITVCNPSAAAPAGSLIAQPGNSRCRHLCRRLPQTPTASGSRQAESA